ncbi:MAG TPA: hypothetical protein VFY04_06110 [Solirubrobacterales bacterium]|nr:hypothetical protein [Solirubrobacterales bacterium]
MASKKETVKLSPGERIRDTVSQATSVSLPLPVHRRLAFLTELGMDASATQAEIIGMLIANASLEPDRVEQEVLDYRKMTVGDVLAGTPEGAGGADVIELAPRGPGRPSRQSAG